LDSKHEFRSYRIPNRHVFARAAKDLQSRKRLKTRARMLLLFGACELATGFLPCDPACPIQGTSLSQSIHNLLAVVAFVTLPLAPLTLSALFKKDRLWIPVTAYSRATGIVTFCLSAVFLAGSFAQASWKGLAEILLVAVPFLWIETVALRMFKQLKPARG